MTLHTIKGGEDTNSYWEVTLMYGHRLGGDAFVTHILKAHTVELDGYGAYVLLDDKGNEVGTLPKETVFSILRLSDAEAEALKKAAKEINSP